MNTKLKTLGAALLLASVLLIGGFASPTGATASPALVYAAQQVDNKSYWPGSAPTAKTFGVFWDFVRDQEYNSTDFTTTLVSAGGSVSSVAAEDLLYGTLLFTTDDAAADGAQIQSLNTCFQTAVGKHLSFSVRIVTGADVTNDIIEAGLVGTDTTFVTGHVDGITIRKADTETTMKLDMVKAGGGTTSDYTTYSLNTVAVSTAYEYTVDEYTDAGDATKGTVKVWCNGTLLLNRRVTADLPTAVLTPSVGILDGASNAARTMRLDYFGATEQR